MKKYLIASHGKFASGLKSSIKVLTGKTDISTIDAYLDGSENNKSIDEQLDEFIKKIKPNDFGIIFTDLVGGSVNREVMIKVNKIPNIFVITSVNLPIVMSVLLDKEKPTAEHLQKLIDESPVQLSVLPKDEPRKESDDDFLS